MEFSLIFIDSGLFSQYFAYKRYFNTIIGPWDLSRIVDNGRLYILTEYNVFWTGLARSGPGPARVGASLKPCVSYEKLFVNKTVKFSKKHHPEK